VILATPVRSDRGVALNSLFFVVTWAPSVL
jgi:hypothetical protein